MVLHLASRRDAAGSLDMASAILTNSAASSGCFHAAIAMGVARAAGRSDHQSINARHLDTDCGMPSRFVTDLDALLWRWPARHGDMG